VTVAASVVIPARNEAARLPLVLEAVRRAAARVEGGVEVIVSDHGSRDETASVARLHGARVIDARRAHTIAAVRNRAAWSARGRILAFLDADCVPDEGWLEAAIALFADEPRAGAAGLAPEVANDAGWIARASALVASPRPPERREEARWLPSANLIVRRSTFEHVGGFDEALVTCEDYDLTVRIRARGEELLRDPALRTTHLREPTTLRALFRKERWRGIASLEGARRHGLVLGELPSLILPLAHLAVVLVLVLVLVLGRFALVPPLVLLLLTPSLLLAARTAWRARRPDSLPGLAAFFLVYCAARTAALKPEARTA